MRSNEVSPASLEAKNPFDASSLHGSAEPHPSSSSSSIFPDASSPKDPVFLDPSSSRGSVFPDSSPAKGPVFSDPSSPRDSLFPDHSAPKGSFYPDTSSPSGSAFPDRSSPRVSPPPKPSTPRCSVASDPSNVRNSLAPEVFLPRHSISLTQLSRNSAGKDADKKDSASKLQGLDWKKKKLKNLDDTPNWLWATMALLLICLLLLSMVSLMTFKVKQLEWKTTEEIRERNVQILRLSETLKQLQIGKVQACAMCNVQWVQRADLCFLFSNLKMAWQSSRSFCAERSSALAVPESREETMFLSQESKKYFTVHRGQHTYHKFWFGWSHAEFSKNTFQNRSLPAVRKPQSDLCIYLQNGIFSTHTCYTSLYFICKKRVRYSWS